MSRTLAIFLGLALAGQAATAGPAARPATDANIVTGLDISGSMPGADRRLELVGIAAALRSPELIAAIRRGREGQIGFAVFAWHHRRYEVVPWTLVSDAADAEAVARAVEARALVDVNAEARRDGADPIGRLTDVSQAIDHAGALLASAPFAASRSVVNIVGNGTDNMGEPAVTARDRLLGTGASVNAVVFGFGADGAELDYYRAEVAGGPGAFVLTAESGEDIAEVMRRKFLQDLVAGAPPPRGLVVDSEQLLGMLPRARFLFSKGRRDAPLARASALTIALSTRSRGANSVRPHHQLFARRASRSVGIWIGVRRA